MPNILPPNYQYWQENGFVWSDEYDRRKKYKLIYHIQEFLLAEYFSHCSPAKVLEFGCGVGRHLKYLRTIPGIDVYGYDQSPTMLKAISQWADSGWITGHIVTGPPVGYLPYADKSFDITFSAEVLVHVRPEDLPGILAELIRVTKWHVFHLETAPGYALVPNAHNGCWYHDLVEAYSNEGYECKMLPQAYSSHAPYRAILDPLRSPPSISISVSKLWQMEATLQPNLDQQDSMKDQLVSIQTRYQNLLDELATCRAQNQELSSQIIKRQDEFVNTLDELTQCRAHNQELYSQTKRMQTEFDKINERFSETNKKLEDHTKRLIQFSNLAQRLESVLNR